MNPRHLLIRFIQRLRLGLVAIGIWGLRNIADRKLNDALPHIFAVLDKRLLSELQRREPTITIETAIRAAIWEVLDEGASSDQVAIVQAIFDPKYLLTAHSDD